MRIIIETIPHQSHRYSTVGDYYVLGDGTRMIRVSELPDERMSLLIALHELIEQALTEARGIPEGEIAAFDTAVPADSPYAEDPGHDPAAPYHREHVFAECIERLMAAELGVNWQDYEKAIEALG